MPLVLMYHSIGEVPAGTDIFDLHVGPECFREQIRLLASHYDILPLSELYHGARSGKLARNSLAITFDDGYANNLSAAGPILREFSAPATLFVCTGLLGRQSYWWDELAQVILTATRHPSKLADIAPEFAGAERLLSDSPIFHDPAGLESKGAALRQLTIEVWGALRHLGLDRIYDLLSELHGRFAPNVDLADVRPLRADEVRMAADFFTIGAHTLTHPFLTTVDDERLQREISESWSVCRTLSDQPVDCFSYPFGDVDDRVARAAAAHMSLACTVQEGAVNSDSDPLRIPRVQIPAWPADELKSRLDAVMQFPARA